jgi:hypothetical protein
MRGDQGGIQIDHQWVLGVDAVIRRAIPGDRPRRVSRRGSSSREGRHRFGRIGGQSADQP